jgi:hypothetical protein
MAKKFYQLIDKMPAPALQRAQAKAQAILAEMPLNELRQARIFLQKMLADVLYVQQPYIAKIAGIKLCESYNLEYGVIHGVDYSSVMPTNLNGRAITIIPKTATSSPP